ncbi:hypothetical protein PpBr36_04951 [Pyricularia pennisetigena]|uniref:hypothetical protein n=1 Tax=Pyricularia pennisetigena TaxID=1578925 RepID=UPI0011514EA9|nr:hypothetical protein PpBr36_04951 [Pyricularia pennisetigena]TLS26245.1 hypothetical protein PpBr36_04951 [Pyricularia pennisetigena]
MDRNEFLNRSRLVSEQCIVEWGRLQAEGKAQQEVETQNDLRWAYTVQVEKLATELVLAKYDREKTRHQEVLANLTARAPPPTPHGVQAAVDAEYMLHRDRIVAMLKGHKELLEWTLRGSRLTRMDQILHLRDNVPTNEQDDYTKQFLKGRVKLDSHVIRKLAAFYKIFHVGDPRQRDHPGHLDQVSESIVQPKSSRWPGLAMQVVEDDMRIGRGLARPAFRDAPSSRAASRLQDADERITPMRNSLAAAGFEFEKFLGVGGHGLAALFRCIDRFGQTRRVVVKMDLYPPSATSDFGLAGEKKLLTKLTGRMHILQRVSLDRLRANMLSSDPRTRALDESDDILVLEFMGKGDVDKLICTLVERRLKLNSQILWQIFKCLFKGCVAMAWPDKNAPQYDGAVVSETSQGLETDAEEYADFSEPSSRAVIHFDIDPCNVLIGNVDINGVEHDTLPVFKIGDFGVAEVVNRDDEQFCQEWDYIFEAPYYERQHDPTNKLYSTAGRYNKYHNVYQAAVVMWCLITQVRVPQPKLETFYDGDGTVIYTYGKELMGPQYDHVDVVLRQALCHCLAHDPDMRPNFEALERLINSKTDPRHWDRKMRDETELLRTELFSNPSRATGPAPQGPSQGPDNQQQPPLNNLRQMHHDARQPPAPPPVIRPIPSQRPVPDPPSGGRAPLRRVRGRIPSRGAASGPKSTRLTPPVRRAYNAVGRMFVGSGQPRQQSQAQFYGLNYDGQNVQASSRRRSTATRVKEHLVGQWDKLWDKYKDHYYR